MKMKTQPTKKKRKYSSSKDASCTTKVTKVIELLSSIFKHTGIILLNTWKVPAFMGNNPPLVHCLLLAFFQLLRSFTP
jgi:hypothetical protein